MKQKMDEFTKAKLIYTIEISIFALAFLVIAILQIVRVIKFGETHLRVINWITIFGASIGVLDFIWFLNSPVRRKKNSMLDKCLLVPLMIYILVFDIICFINYENPQVDLAQIMIPIALIYVSAVYTLEAVYHWYKPVPMLFEALEEEKENPQEEVNPDVDDNSNQENKEEN
ncbi:MAG: hypothetical protein E7178_03790 [Erysipelotrichaceae bacterium]|nr:hypothetical protein [Erysipelotrichaceae bacterium]